MEKQLVIKSNFLVEASYRLSAVEQKIILTLATKINKNDQGFEQYLFNLRDLAHFLGIETNADYEYLRKVTHNLLSKVLTLKKEGSILQTHWLESVEYFDNQSTVGLRFNPDLKPFLIQLKNNFTKYLLTYAIQLKSRFSIRLYELLKQYETIGFRLFLLEELRDRLGVKPDEYPFYANFKAKVLKVAQKELKNKTDLSFKFEEIKTGRKVTEIKFFIVTEKKSEQPPGIDLPSVDFEQGNLFSNEPDDPEEMAAIQRVLKLLPAQYQGKKSIEKLLREFLPRFGFDYVVRNIEYANDNSNATKSGANSERGSNYRNYLAKALKGDFGLAYQEDQEALQAKEKAATEKKNAELMAKQKEQEKIEKENNLLSEAREILKTMTPEELQAIETEAIIKLPPDLKKMALEKRFTAQIAIKRAMEKVVVEKYFSSSDEKRTQEAGKNLFGKYASGKSDLSENRKTILKQKL